VFLFFLDVIKKLRYFDMVIKLDPSLEPDWDEDNVNHIAQHGLRPEQVEEVYYGEGPFPTLALKTKKRGGEKAKLSGCGQRMSRVEIK